VEKSWGGSGFGNGTFDEEHFYGHCLSRGKKGYVNLVNPFSQVSI
jgi:hypothetical protein